MIWLVGLLSALGASMLTLLGIWGLYRWKIRPDLDARIDVLKEVADAIPQRVKSGINQGIQDSLRELPETTLKATTRSVVKMGASLMEGGLSSLMTDRRAPSEVHTATSPNRKDER